MKTVIPPHIKSFSEIQNEYLFTRKSVIARTNYLNKQISMGYNIPSVAEYYNYSNPKQSTDRIKLEIEWKYTLELVSAFEAKIVYYLFNLKKFNKRSHPFYKTYIDTIPHNIRNGNKYLMFNHIIEVFKKEIQPINNVAYSELKNLVNFRNWLSHGRGGDFQSQYRKFDFYYSLEIIELIISILPNFPNNLK